MVECRYRGRVIGWLVTASDGFLSYISADFYQREDFPLETWPVWPKGLVWKTT